jgi:predicted amidohydrolase YtcJ
VGLSPHALHRAGGGRLVYLSRVDAHSAAASSGLLALVDPGTDGYAADGLLRREAHHVVRRHAHASITTAQRRQAQRAALRHGAGRGIVAVHECSGPDIAGEDDFTELLALAAADPALPEVFGYWGETDPAKARELGAVGAGGDLFVDGSLGSHTAYLRQPYADAADGRGHAYLDARRLAEHLVACTEAGVQAGFHAVGDAAVARVLTALAVAEPRVGLARLRDLRHRVEHATVLDRALIAGLVEFGLVASVQPTFDRMWGGEHGMYARRLGPRRALDTNPIGAMRSVGVPLAFGSDSPVTAMDPWESVVAAMTHHSPTQRIGVRTAFAAHSRGGWRAVGRDDEGRLVPGAPATFAAWDCDAVSDGLPRLLPADADEPSPRKPRCRLAVRNGVDLAGPGD